MLYAKYRLQNHNLNYELQIDCKNNITLFIEKKEQKLKKENLKTLENHKLQ